MKLTQQQRDAHFWNAANIPRIFAAARDYDRYLMGFTDLP